MSACSCKSSYGSAVCSVEDETTGLGIGRVAIEFPTVCSDCISAFDKSKLTYGVELPPSVPPDPPPVVPPLVEPPSVDCQLEDSFQVNNCWLQRLHKIVMWIKYRAGAKQGAFAGGFDKLSSLLKNLIIID